MEDVFLSYSRHNEDTMQRLREDLQRQGISVWTDRTGLKKGSPRWKSEIQEAIEGARCLVVILSPEAKNATWVGWEVSYAQTFDLPVYAVLVSGNERTAVPINLINADRFDARRRYSLAIAELVAALQAQLGRVPSKAAFPTTSSNEVRRQKIEEIVRAMGYQTDSGEGIVGRVGLSFGLYAHQQDRNSDYLATIPLTNDEFGILPSVLKRKHETQMNDVLEAARKLELRGWKLGSFTRIPQSSAKAYFFFLARWGYEIRSHEG